MDRPRRFGAARRAAREERRRGRETSESSGSDAEAEPPRRRRFGRNRSRGRTERENDEDLGARTTAHDLRRRGGARSADADSDTDGTDEAPAAGPAAESGAARRPQTLAERIRERRARTARRSSSKEDEEDDEDGKFLDGDEGEDGSEEQPLLPRRGGAFAAAPPGDFPAAPLPRLPRIRAADLADDPDIRDEELGAFLAGAFEDGTDPPRRAGDAAPSSSALPAWRRLLGPFQRAPRGIVYMESDASGAFFGVPMSADALAEERERAGLDGGGGGGGRRRRAAAAAAAPRDRVGGARGAAQAGFFFFKGVLAGFSLVAPYLRYAERESDAQFLLYYQSVCGEVRRLLFLLSTLAAVASVDALQDRAARWARLGAAERLAAALPAALAALALLFTLLAASFDARLQYRDNFSGAQWHVEAAADASLRAALRAWEAYSVLRFLAAFALWALACKELYDLRSAAAAAKALREDMRGELSAARRAAARLRGLALEGMGAGELRALLSEQSAGRRSVEAAIAALEERRPGG